jgi:hypothetical protein
MKRKFQVALKTVYLYMNYNSQIKSFRTHVGIESFLVLVCGTRVQSLSALLSNTLRVGYRVLPRVKALTITLS